MYVKKSNGSKKMISESGGKVQWRCSSCGISGAARVNNWNSPKARTCCGGEFYRNRDRLQIVWTDMHSRVHDEKHPAHDRYGHLSISGWESFADFKQWALSSGYKYGLDLDRIDNSQGYNPKNCRFVTRSENANNTRANRLLTAFGETKTATQWERDSRCSVQAQTILARIDRYGWESLEKAISYPSGQKENPTSKRLCKEEGCDAQHLAKGWCSRHYEKNRKRRK